MSLTKYFFVLNLLNRPAIHKKKLGNLRMNERSAVSL